MSWLAVLISHRRQIRPLESRIAMDCDLDLMTKLLEMMKPKKKQEKIEQAKRDLARAYAKHLLLRTTS